MSRRAADAPDPYGNGVTLTSRGSDGWRVRWFEPPDSRRIEDRRQKSFGPSRLADAREFAHELSADLELRGAGAGDRRARRATPWRDVYARWLHVKTTGGEWSPSNAAQVRQLLDKWAAPVVGHLPVGGIHRDDYQRVMATLHGAGRDGSADRVRSLLAQLERWAADSGYCDPRRFPVRSSPRRAEGSQTGADDQFVPEHLRPDPARVARLRLAAAEVGRPPRWWRALQVDVAARSGLRLGEQLALRSCAVNLEAGTLQVNWQYVSEPTRPHVLKRPKGGKTRTTIAFPSMTEDLGRRLSEVNGAGDPECPDCHERRCGLLFPAPRGGPWTKDGLGRNLARAAYAATQSDPDPALRWPQDPRGGWALGWHSLRHAAATTLLDDLRLPAADVALLLGHTERVLLQTYYGVVAGTLERARLAAAGR